MAATLPLSLLSTLRLAVGTSCFTLPSLTCSTLFYTLPAHSLLAVRMVGCRDAALGALLYTSKTPEARKAILLAGVAVDALDVAACAWGYLYGDVEAAPAVAFGGGAVSFLVLAAMAWRGGGFGKLVQGVGKH